MQGRTAARTVLLEMARDEARAERIRSVIEQRKADDPAFTTAHIADRVGVSERAVGAWKATGALSRENSDKLAKVVNVDPVVLWLGRKTETPDLLDSLPGTGPSHQVEEGFAEFRGYVAQILDRLGDASEERKAMLDVISQHEEVLEEQSALLAELREVVKVLPAIQAVLDALPPAEGAPLPAERPASESAEPPDVAAERTRRTG